jgi:hypothetical protein
VKEILRCPLDEVKQAKLELLCSAVRQEIEAETDVFFASEEEIERLAQAVEACESGFADEVGAADEKTLKDAQKIPKGARLMVETASICVAAGRREVASLVRSLDPGQSVRVKMRPLNTCREPPRDAFAKVLMKTPHPTVQQLAKQRGYEDVRDRLLLSCWDALFLSACEGWTAEDSVTNTTHSNALEMGYWFHRPSQVDSQIK